jgi:two-component system sensor histidine kinase RegB
MMSLLDPPFPAFSASWRPLRLATLVGLRWLAIIGQVLGVLFVEFGLGFPLPFVECLGLIVLSVLLNLWLVFRFGEGYRPTPTVATLQIGWDLCQLGALLALTGGLQNPFSLLLLAPVSVAATTLPQRPTVILAGLAVAVASVLALVHLDLPWAPDEHLAFHRVYVIGIWVSIVCGVTFVTVYTGRVAHEARQLADALAATELELSRHEQLSALDGLAAAAAHELGTPLSTIALAAREMRDDAPAGALRDDADLIVSQTARCRDILGKLRSLREAPGDPFAAVPLRAVLEEVAEPHRTAAIAIAVLVDASAGPEPVIRRNAGMLYGLGNLVENAAQFARGGVSIEAAWDREALSVAITDDGPGFPTDLVARLGEPYLTTGARGGAAPEREGLGLGIFIAKTLLERTGARLQFENVGEDGHARVRIVWPRRTIEATA